MEEITLNEEEANTEDSPKLSTEDDNPEEQAEESETTTGVIVQNNFQISFFEQLLVVDSIVIQFKQTCLF